MLSLTHTEISLLAAPEEGDVTNEARNVTNEARNVTHRTLSESIRLVTFIRLD